MLFRQTPSFLPYLSAHHDRYAIKQTIFRKTVTFPDRTRIRRPHADAGARCAARIQVSSQLVVSAVVPPLVEKIQVLRTQADIGTPVPVS